jgi:hypothetical protein
MNLKSVGILVCLGVAALTSASASAQIDARMFRYPAVSAT